MPVSAIEGFKKVSPRGGFGFYLVMVIAYGKIIETHAAETDTSARAVGRLLSKKFKKSRIKIFTFADMWEMSET
jgi:hypothetical protein